MPTKEELRTDDPKVAKENTRKYPGLAYPIEKGGKPGEPFLLTGGRPD